MTGKGVLTFAVGNVGVVGDREDIEVFLDHVLDDAALLVLSLLLLLRLWKGDLGLKKSGAGTSDFALGLEGEGIIAAECSCRACSARIWW